MCIAFLIIFRSRIVRASGPTDEAHTGGVSPSLTSLSPTLMTINGDAPSKCEKQTSCQAHVCCRAATKNRQLSDRTFLPSACLTKPYFSSFSYMPFSQTGLSCVLRFQWHTYLFEWKYICLNNEISSPAVELTMQWAPPSLSSKVKRPGIEADNCLLVSRLNVKLINTLTPYLRVQGAQGHTYLFL